MYRRDRYVNVSDEYLETVCKWLTDWSQKEDSWIIAQFLKKYGIGWSYFKYFLSISPKLENVFETTIAGLCEKWLLYAMDRKDMPQHMQKIIMKYLRAYDNHAYDMEQEARKELAREETVATLDYVKEDYAREQLEGVYKRIYEINANKRRSGKKSE